MRVISKVKDYYDGCMRYGFDDSVLYVRNQELIYEGENPPKEFSQFKPFTKCSFYFFYLIFCGKVYPGIRHEFYNGHRTFFTRAPYFEYNEQRKQEYKHKCQEYSYSYETPTDHVVLPWLPEEVNHDLQLHESAFIHRSPAILVTKSSNQTIITKNVNLGDLEFYRVLDSAQTFQEIDMFLSCILSPEEKPMIEIDDKYKILEHGFDKQSFRKPKSAAHASTNRNNNKV